MNGYREKLVRSIDGSLSRMNEYVAEWDAEATQMDMLPWWAWNRRAKADERLRRLVLLIDANHYAAECDRHALHGYDTRVRESAPAEDGDSHRSETET